MLVMATVLEAGVSRDPRLRQEPHGFWTGNEHVLGEITRPLAGGRPRFTQHIF